MTRFERRSADWLSAEEALGRVLAQAHPLEAETVPASDALGRAVAQGVKACVSLPPWDNAGMDGYAVLGQEVMGASSEAPVVLTVVRETRAGQGIGPTLGPGEAIRIMTGAPIPPGADSVIRVEHTDAEGAPGTVRIFSDSDVGANLRPGGEDMRAGEEVLPKGATIGAGAFGLLAATGHSTVQVFRRPRVAVLSNGDELAGPAELHRVLEGEAIPETNAPTLVAGITLLGGLPIHLGIARDTRESILEKVAEARETRADVLITSGGASMGERDLMKRVLDEVG